MILTNKLTAIGDAIRTKTGGTEQLTLDQMAEQIVGFSGSGEMVLPENARLYYVGNAISTLDFSGLSLESNAVGVLQEG